MFNCQALRSPKNLNIDYKGGHFFQQGPKKVNFHEPFLTKTVLRGVFVLERNGQRQN